MTGLLDGSTTSPTPDLSILAQYGLVGFIALVALVVAFYLYQRMAASKDEEIHRLEGLLTLERERADRMERAVAETNAAVRTQVSGMVTEAIRAVNDANARRP